MKISINGEEFEFDGDKKPMLEALELERQLGITYGKYEQDLAAGSMVAIAGFVWQVWYRNGRKVDFADILNGTIDIDVAEVMRSLEAYAAELEAQEKDPTVSPGSATTGTSTSPRSRGTSTSGRGK